MVTSTSASLIIGALSLASPASGHPGIDLARMDKAKKTHSVTNRVLYLLDKKHAKVSTADANTLGKQAKDVAKALNCVDSRRVFPDAGKYEPAHKVHGLNLWYSAQCDSAGAAVNALNAFDKMTTSNEYKYVEKMEIEMKVKTIQSSDDPLLGFQPHYPAVNLYDAWEIETGSPDVVVQVLDTGIDMSHEDLQNNIWTNEGEICGNGIDDDGNGYIDDCHGYNFADNTGTDLLGNHWHGTHCGGTIAADTDNGIGVAGVAGGTSTSPGVKLMIAVGFGDSNTGGFAEALVYGADNGAQISSNSWGYTSPGAIDSTVTAAVDYYNSVSGIVVFAAGNDNSDANYYPGALEGTIAVAAVNNNGVRAGFSNYGSWIDIAAPGVDVYSTLTNNQYGTASGTSMACPHVAGILALGLSADPSTSKEKLLDCAYSTARNVDDVNDPPYHGGLGAGFIDTRSFIECVAWAAPTASPTISKAPTTATPTPSPTFSPAPTPACVCDQVMDLTIVTDNYPSETTWTVEMVDPLDNCLVTSANGGPYNNAGTTYTHDISSQICAGQTYKFTVKDSWGDGICCTHGQGFYSLKLDGVEVAGGGEFGSTTQVVTFTAPANSLPPLTSSPPSLAPISSPVPAPSVSPIPAPTSSPIPAPTSSPVPAPTTSPIPAPSVSPVPAPTSSPVPAPTSSSNLRKPTAAPTSLRGRVTSSPTMVSEAAPGWGKKIMDQLDVITELLSSPLQFMYNP